MSQQFGKNKENWKNKLKISWHCFSVWIMIILHLSFVWPMVITLIIVGFSSIHQPFHQSGSHKLFQVFQSNKILTRETWNNLWLPLWWKGWWIEENPTMIRVITIGQTKLRWRIIIIQTEKQCQEILSLFFQFSLFFPNCCDISNLRSSLVSDRILYWVGFLLLIVTKKKP
jgi:hypothetical protein